MEERDRDGLSKVIVLIGSVCGGATVFFTSIDPRLVAVGALFAAALAALVRGRTWKARLLFAIPATVTIVGASLTIAAYLFFRGRDIFSYEVAIPFVAGAAPGWIAYLAVKDSARFADGDLKPDE